MAMSDAVGLMVLSKVESGLTTCVVVMVASYEALDDGEAGGSEVTVTVLYNVEVEWSVL